MSSPSLSTPEVVPCEGVSPSSVYEDWRSSNSPSLSTPEVVPCEGVSPSSVYEDWRSSKLHGVVVMRENRLYSAQCEGSVRSGQRVRRCAHCQRAMHRLLYAQDRLSPLSGSSDEERVAFASSTAAVYSYTHDSEEEDEDFVAAERTRSKKRKLNKRENKKNNNSTNSANKKAKSTATHALLLSERDKVDDKSKVKREPHRENEEEEDKDGPLIYYTTPKALSAQKKKTKSNRNKTKKIINNNNSTSTNNNNNNNNSHKFSVIHDNDCDDDGNEVANRRFKAIAERAGVAVRANDETAQYLCTQALLCDTLFSHNRARSSISVALTDSKLARWSLCWGFSHRDREGRLTLPALDEIEKEQWKVKKEDFPQQEQEHPEDEQKEYELISAAMHAPAKAQAHAGQQDVEKKAYEEGEEAVEKTMFDRRSDSEAERARRRVPVLTRDDLLRVFGSADFDMERTSSSSADRSLRPLHAPSDHHNSNGKNDSAGKEKEALEPEEVDPELRSLFEKEDDDESLKSIHSEGSSISPLLFFTPAQLQATSLNSNERRRDGFLSPFPFQLAQESPSSAGIALQRVQQFLSVKRHPACLRYAVSVDCRKWWDRNICYHCRTTLNKRKVKSLEDRAVLAGKVNYSLLCFDELVIQHDMLKEEIARLQKRLAELMN